MKLIAEYIAETQSYGMKKLLDPGNDYLKTEKNVEKYLRSLPDSQIRVYYEAIEFTPFPTLLSKEYSRRFNTKARRN